jgi:cathepsin L
MKVTCAVTALLSTAGARTLWSQLGAYSFEQYVAEFEKDYSPAEKVTREKIFDERLAVIRAHNDDAVQTWKRGVNPLTDRTAAELAELKGLDKAMLHSGKAGLSAQQPRAMESIKDLPASIDWRSHNGASAVTPVKNQGACGSCWSFASAETLESHWFLKTGQMQELSEQFILDCTPNPGHCGGDGGCAGGTAKLAYDRLAVLGGCPGEYTYPYVSGTGVAGTCHGLPLPPPAPHSGKPMKAANVTGHISLPTNSYADIMNAVGTAGPLAVTVDAGAWHDYESGVFAGGNHTNPDLDHLVQMVGYGTDKATGQDFFLIRNSWTPLWGEDGYIRLARSATPSCGTDLTPLDGDGCTGGPATVKVCGQSGILYDAAYPLVE